MKSILLSFAVLSLLGMAQSYQTTDGGHSQEIRRNKFGAMEVIDWTETGMKKTVMKPFKSFQRDYIRQSEFLQEAQDQIQVNTANMATDTLYTCDNRMMAGDKDSAGYFFPIYAANLSAPGVSSTFTEGTCFQNIVFSYTVDAVTSDVTVTIDASKPKSLLCKDWFLIGNNDLQHVETITDKGVHTVTFTNLDSDEKLDVNFEGFQVYMFCDGYIDTFISVFKTFLCFFGGLTFDPNGGPITGSHIPAYMEKANVEFFHNTMGWDLVERETQVVEIDESLIQSGDFLAILRLDGLDPLIMYGSGSHAGHSTMALRFDGELYIVESQDAWYWPIQNIQRNKFSDWLQYAKNCDFHVAHLPLSPENRAKFNETAAQEFFWATEGLPYGYHNFLFGWIDTPEQNWPPLLPPDLIPIVFSVFSRLAPAAAESFYLQAMNKRLGTVGENDEQLTTTALQHGMKMEEVLAIVEEDAWVYNDGLSMVCSSYVAAMYKAAGLFGDLSIQATEFTPRDVYTLNFFDLNYTRPQACIDADPDQNFCQILGKYRLTFPGYSTIDPYDHMAENCPTVAPTYDRPVGC